MDTQRKQVLSYMRENGSISSLFAKDVLDIMDCPKRISELRSMGYEIDGERVSHTNKFGRKTYYMNYTLMEDKEC